MTLDAVETVKCPDCGESKLYKDGIRYLDDGSTVQRFLCRNCGLRFSDSSKPYNKCQTIPQRQICAILQEAKNLTTAKELETFAGESKTTEQNIKGKILEFAFYLKKQGRTQDTIKSYESALNSLITGGANLLDPESVKEALAFNETWNNTSKTMKTIVYDRFTGFLGLKWDKPKYKAQKKIAFIPTEEEIDGLIAASPKKTATILQLLKETGARIGEA